MSANNEVTVAPTTTDKSADSTMGGGDSSAIASTADDATVVMAVDTSTAAGADVDDDALLSFPRSRLAAARACDPCNSRVVSMWETTSQLRPARLLHRKRKVASGGGGAVALNNECNVANATTTTATDGSDGNDAVELDSDVMVSEVKRPLRGHFGSNDDGGPSAGVDDDDDDNAESLVSTEAAGVVLSQSHFQTDLFQHLLRTTASPSTTAQEGAAASTATATVKAAEQHGANLSPRGERHAAVEAPQRTLGLLADEVFCTENMPTD